MKKLLYLLIAATLTSLLACGGDDEPVVKRATGKLDPDAMISISPAPGVKIRSTTTDTTDTDTLLTAIEIVKNTRGMKYHTAYFDNVFYSDPVHTRRGFGSKQRDTVNAKLKMWGTDIISMQGELVKDFIYAKDVVLTTYDDDTVAYIPNSVLEEARVKIETAFNDSNYTEVYRLFDEAYTFIPITTKKWRKLKEEGKN